MIKKDLLKKGLAIAAFVALSFSIPVLAGCNAITGNGQAGIVAEADSSGSGEKTDHDDKADYDESECTVIALNGTSASAEGSGVTTADGTVTITEEGSYILRGSFDGIIIVETGKEAKVQIILDGATVKSAGSAGIYVKSADKVYLTLADDSMNEITNSGEFVPLRLFSMSCCLSIASSTALPVMASIRRTPAAILLSEMMRTIPMQPVLLA